MSPWVATTRLSLVATMTLQPVPQNRQAALSHFNSLASRSVTRLAASAGAGMPAAAALGCRHDWSPTGLAGIDGVKDKGGGIDVRQQGDRVEDRAKRARIGHV